MLWSLQKREVKGVCMLGWSMKGDFQGHFELIGEAVVDWGEEVCQEIIRNQSQGTAHLQATFQ